MTVPGRVVPLRFNLSALVRRSVASLYSHLVTRPMGQALRLGIESQIGDLGDLCVSVLDFSEVVVLDYSCADEAVAKLIQRYRAEDRPADAFFIARGVTEHHQEALEEVLVRHGLWLVAEVEEVGYTLIGATDGPVRRAWDVLESAGAIPIAESPEKLAMPANQAEAALEALVDRRVAVGVGSPKVFYALSALTEPEPAEG